MVLVLGRIQKLGHILSLNHEPLNPKPWKGNLEDLGFLAAPQKATNHKTC